MGHAYTAKGSKRYRYYTCIQAQKRGWDTCPSKSVPAGEMEQFVIEQIRSIGADPTVLAETVRNARSQSQTNLRELRAEEQAIKRELTRHNTRLQRLAGNNDAIGEMAILQDRIGAAEQRATEVRERIAVLTTEMLDER